MCQCDCGNKVIARVDSIRDGSIVSCGCYNKEVHSGPKEDLTGKQFGKLLVLGLGEKNPEHRGTYWHCKCLVCGREDLNLRMDAVKKHYSCGCVKSKGEQEITKLLLENKIKFEREKVFSDLITLNKGYLRFDFYLPDYNCCIEYDGEQHFSTNNSGWNTKEYLELTQKRDMIKNEYCKKYNIHLIRIPYTHFKELNIKDLLLDTSDFILN